MVKIYADYNQEDAKKNAETADVAHNGSNF